MHRGSGLQLACLLIQDGDSNRLLACDCLLLHCYLILAELCLRGSALSMPA